MDLGGLREIVESWTDIAPGTLLRRFCEAGW
jgi:hypothetical protein